MKEKQKNTKLFLSLNKQGLFGSHGRALVLKIINNLNESQHSGDASSRLAKGFSADPLVQVPVDPSALTWSLCEKGKKNISGSCQNASYRVVMYQEINDLEMYYRGDIN